MGMGDLSMASGMGMSNLSMGRGRGMGMSNLSIGMGVWQGLKQEQGVLPLGKATLFTASA